MDFGLVDEQAREYKGVFFTRDMTLASGAQVIAGVGFRPKALIFFSTRDGAGTGGASWGGGVDGDAGAPGNIGLRHNIVANQWTGNSAGNQINMIQGSGIQYQGTVLDADFNSDGFTINWLRLGAPTGLISVNFIAFR